jgi:outer membrane protein
VPGAAPARPDLAASAPGAVTPPTVLPPNAPARPDVLAFALAPQAGGLTPDEAAKGARQTKASVRVKRAQLDAASAKVDQALVTFFPRLSVTASYTQLSPIKPPSIPIAGIMVNFPAPLEHSAVLSASLALPISDYVLRISQGYAAAKHSERGRRLDVEAETLQAAADARVAYFNWVRSRGQIVVSQQSVDQARAHVIDANRSFAVGLVSRADVLRFEAQVAAAQQLLAEAQALSGVTEEQLRIVIGLPTERPLAVGFDVLHEPPTVPTEKLAELQDLAMQRRLEIRALDETELSLKELVKVAQSAYAPRVEAFADATYANPNPRFFPAQDRFDGSWDAGVRLSWTINDSFTAAGASAEAKANAAVIAAQKSALRDGLRLELASAYNDVQKSAFSIEAAERQLAAAEETLRVRNELFRNGKATSTDVVDAEGEVTFARLSRLNARIGLLVARVRLEHAVGRDVPSRPAGE